MESMPLPLMLPISSSISPALLVGSGAGENVMSKKINIHVDIWEGILNNVYVTGLKDDEYDLEFTEYDSQGDEQNIHTINGVPVLEGKM